MQHPGRSHLWQYLAFVTHLFPNAVGSFTFQEKQNIVADVEKISDHFEKATKTYKFRLLS